MTLAVVIKLDSEPHCMNKIYNTRFLTVMLLLHVRNVHLSFLFISK